MTSRIYLDNNGSTFLDPRVYELIVKTLPTVEGNPSSIHSAGRHVRNLVNKARSSIAAFLGVKPNEILFTSSGTECANMFIRGVLTQKKQGHLITSLSEHSSVFATAEQMEKKGYEVTFLQPGPWGAISPEAVQAAIKSDTCLIALMAVNNETGIKTDIDAIASLAYKFGIPFYVDGVALLGKELFSIPAGVSAMGFSGHKLHALQGTGFAFVRSGMKVNSLLIGGNQELGRRAGTENVLGIVALAKAIELLSEELPRASRHMERLRDQFEKTLFNALPNVRVNGKGPRVVNVSNLAFAGIDGETLLIKLDQAGVIASHGSACSSGALEPSRILLNMGLPLDLVRSSIRFSLSRFNTEEEINKACNIVIDTVAALTRE